MKKFYYIILTICISVFIFSIFSVFSEIKKTNRFGEMKILDEPYPISLDDSISLLEDQSVLLHNKAYGVVQVFDINGKFVWGVQLVTSKNIDANAVSYNNRKLYLYEYYTHTVYEFLNFELSDILSVDTYFSDTDFYNDYPHNYLAKYKSRFTGPSKLSFYTKDGELYKQIELKVDMKIITYTSAFLLMLISGIAFWYFKEKFKESVNTKK